MTSKTSTTASKQGPFQALASYLAGVRQEWDKIQWPTMPQIWGQTLITLVMITIFTLLLWLIDTAYRLMFSQLTP